MADVIAGVPVAASERVDLGRALFDQNSRWLVVHPLDFIALANQDVFERLDEAMAWIEKRAHLRLDFLNRSL